MTESDVAINSYSATSQPEPDPTRSRDTGAPVTHAREDSVAPVTARKWGRGHPQARREADGFLPRPAFRSPWSEDAPSPRCVLEDYRQGAADFGWIYWLPGILPLALHFLLAAPLHIATQRPARTWALVIFIIICWRLASA